MQRNFPLVYQSLSQIDFYWRSMRSEPSEAVGEDNKSIVFSESIRDVVRDENARSSDKIRSSVTGATNFEQVEFNTRSSICPFSYQSPITKASDPYPPPAAIKTSLFFGANPPLSASGCCSLINCKRRELGVHASH